MCEQRYKVLHTKIFLRTKSINFDAELEAFVAAAAVVVVLKSW